MDWDAYKSMYPVVPGEVYDFQKNIGYEFKHIECLYNALIHSSYASEHYRDVCRCNERLEFLGDAVLENVSSEYIYMTRPDDREGSMSSYRASLVCEGALYDCALKFDLPEYLYLGVGEEKNGGRKKPSIVSDAVEAVIGAIYIDGGFEAAKAFVYEYILKGEREKKIHDPKTYVQNLAQKLYKKTPVYECVREEGEVIERVYVMRCYIDDGLFAVVSDRSKKRACEKAALELIDRIEP